MTKEAPTLTKRNVAFMKRCANKRFKKDESVRGSLWISNLPEDERKKLGQLIFNYQDWAPETDLTGTKAAGVVRFNGHYILFRIREISLASPGTMMMPDPRGLALVITHSSEF